MATLDVFNIQRKKVAEIDVSDKVFDAEPKEHLFYDVVRMQLAKRRSGTVSTKTRSEVRGGGRKPWRQKGTGRARAGTIRSPLWKGGGTVFGPKPRDYSIKVPKKVRRAALCTALTLKKKQDKLIVLDKIEVSGTRTKEAMNVLNELGFDRVLIIDENNTNLIMSTRNIPRVKVLPPAGLNLYDILQYESLCVTQECIEKINRRLDV